MDFRSVLLFTQTRACGKANRAMADTSIEKFIDTITTPVEDVKMIDSAIYRVLGGMKKPDLGSAKISTGPTAVLESTVEDGGGNGFLATLC